MSTAVTLRTLTEVLCYSDSLIPNWPIEQLFVVIAYLLLFWRNIHYLLMLWYFFK